MSDQQPMRQQASTHVGIAALLAMTTALAPFALDTFLPAFPAMAASLGTDVHGISLSISLYVFVLATGQLIAGPLSDRFGRSRVLLSGLSIFALASLLLTQAETLDQLLLLRALQAFGGGCSAVCVPAIVRDRLSGVEAAKFFSAIGLIIMVAPAIAPSLGSLLLNFFGWESIFLFLGLYALMLVPLLKAFVFRQQPDQSNHAQAINAWQRYLAVLATVPARRFILLQAMAFAVMLLFITHSSFIYQEHFGATPSNFALLFGANIVLVVMMNLLNRLLLQRVAVESILRWALAMQFTGTVLLILVMLFIPRLEWFLPAMIITIGAIGAIGPNTQACFMEFFADNAGTASALLGATQFALAGFISAVSTLLPENVLTIVCAMAICSAVCQILIRIRNSAN